MKELIKGFKWNSINSIQTAPYRINEALFPIPQEVLDNLTLEDLDHGVIQHIATQQTIEELTTYDIETEVPFTFNWISGLIGVTVKGYADILTDEEVIELKFGKSRTSELRWSYIVQTILYMYAFEKDGIIIYTNYETQRSRFWVLKYNADKVKFMVKVILAYYVTRPYYDEEGFYYHRQGLMDLLSVFVNSSKTSELPRFLKVWKKYCKDKKWELILE